MWGFRKKEKKKDRSLERKIRNDFYDNLVNVPCLLYTSGVTYRAFSFVLISPPPPPRSPPGTRSQQVSARLAPGGPHRPDPTPLAPHPLEEHRT